MFTLHLVFLSFGVHSLPWTMFSLHLRSFYLSVSTHFRRPCSHYIFCLFIFWCPLTSVDHVLITSSVFLSFGVHSLPLTMFSLHLLSFYLSVSTHFRRPCSHYIFCLFIFRCPLTSVDHVLITSSVFLSFGVHSLPSTMFSLHLLSLYLSVSTHFRRPCSHYIFCLFIFRCPLTSVDHVLITSSVFLSFGVHSLPSTMFSLHLLSFYLSVSTHFRRPCSHYIFSVFLSFGVPLTSVDHVHITSCVFLSFGVPLTSVDHVRITSSVFLSFGVHSLPLTMFTLHLVFLSFGVHSLPSTMFSLHLLSFYLSVSTHFRRPCSHYIFCLFIFRCPLTSVDHVHITSSVFLSFGVPLTSVVHVHITSSLSFYLSVSTHFR